MRVTTQDVKGFICIGVCVRIQQKIHVFSPFFQEQNEKLWRLVQSHVSQLAINDFAVRIHLGLLHFTTNQYHVPVYKCLGQLKDPRKKENFSNFIKQSYSMFSKGL